MQNSKLLKLLRCLDAETFRHLKKALESRIFTSNKNLLKLYLHLRKYHPNFDSPRLEKTKIFEHLFPSRPYSDIKLRNLMSEFSVLIEDFLVTKELEKKDFLRQKILLDFYQKRNEELYLKTLKKLTQQLNNSTYRNPEYYAEAFQLALRYTEWSAEHSLVEEDFFQKKEARLLLDNYYGLLRAQLQLAQKASQASAKEIQSKKATTIFDGQALEENLLYRLYQDLEDILHQEQSEKIPSFLEQLSVARQRVKATTRRELFVALLNFCISQMKVEEKEFLPLVFDLYQFGLAEEILLEDQRISTTTFLNVVIIGGRVKAREWTESFLEKFADYIPEEERSDVLILGKAYLYFYTQRFSESLQTLSQYTFQNPFQLYPARTFTLRCYLELYLRDSSYFEALYSQCNAFEKYIRRNELLSPERKKSALAFEQMILKIINKGVGETKNKKIREGLKKELEELRLIDSRSWLLEKIELF